MAGTKFGMDTAAAATTVKTFRTEANNLGDSVKRVDSALQNTWWEGNDKVKFVSEWENSKKQLLQAKALLETCASKLDAQRQEQERTSSN